MIFFQNLPVVHLGIGELAVARKPTIIETLLGSCVSVIMWVPGKNFALMSHSIYPGKKECGDCHYVYCCVKKMNELIIKEKLRRAEVTVKMFGGGMQMQGEVNKNYSTSVGALTSDSTEKELLTLGYTIDAKDIGGNFSRKLLFNTQTGDVFVKKSTPHLFSDL